MSTSIKIVTNMGQLALRIEGYGERAQKGMATQMMVASVKVRNLARDYAPVKSGLLESAIRQDRVRDGNTGASSFVVFVDGKKSRGGKKNPVSEYGWLISNQLRPYGNRGRVLNLGKLSAKKAFGGKKVGGQFLSRALREVRAEVLKDCRTEVSRVFSGRNSNSFRRFDSEDEE